MFEFEVRKSGGEVYGPRILSTNIDGTIVQQKMYDYHIGHLSGLPFDKKVVDCQGNVLGRISETGNKTYLTDKW